MVLGGWGRGAGYILSMRLRRDHDVIHCEGFMINKNTRKIRRKKNSEKKTGILCGFSADVI